MARPPAPRSLAFHTATDLPARNAGRTSDASGSKLLTLPRLWLASAVVIILTAIILRPLLP